MQDKRHCCQFRPLLVSTVQKICGQGFVALAVPCRSVMLILAEPSHSLRVSDRRPNTPKSAQTRAESLCAGLWVTCRIFLAWFGPVLGPSPGRNRRFPAGSLQVFGPLNSSAELSRSFRVQPAWPVRRVRRAVGNGFAITLSPWEVDRRRVPANI